MIYIKTHVTHAQKYFIKYYKYLFLYTSEIYKITRDGSSKFLQSFSINTTYTYRVEKKSISSIPDTM